MSSEHTACQIMTISFIWSKAFIINDIWRSGAQPLPTEACHHNDKHCIWNTMRYFKFSWILTILFWRDETALYRNTCLIAESNAHYIIHSLIYPVLVYSEFAIQMDLTSYYLYMNPKWNINMKCRLLHIEKNMEVYVFVLISLECRPVD
jgi:hypothetical protein